MLEQRIIKGFGSAEDYNCAEKILNGANETYGLGLEGKGLKMAAAFGGGMGTGRTCGAVVGAIMVLGMEYTATVAHQSPMVKEMAVEFQAAFTKMMGSIDCMELKEHHWSETAGCTEVVRAAAEVLDSLMKGKVADEY